MESEKEWGKIIDIKGRNRLLPFCLGRFGSTCQMFLFVFELKALPVASTEA
jgi:hypothetical protein